MGEMIEIIVGDARTSLAAIPSESCQMCCTSPPYWGLRDYGADGQIGLEKSPQEYVQQIVSVFHEVWRVLKPDGSVWLNLGDSYSGSGKGGNPEEGKQATNKGSQSIGVLYGKIGETAREAALTNVSRRWSAEQGFRRKQLVGIPWRVAFALQDSGWYLRRDIIWHKPNAMPESVTDRPAVAHEYLFLLTKSATYYYDNEAIKEPASDAMLMEVDQGYDGFGLKDYEAAGVQNPSSVKTRIIANVRKRADQFGGNKHNGETTKHSDGSVYTGKIMVNKRTVWTIPTQPFKGAHFATFPKKLVEPCILAGSRPGDTILDPFAGVGTTGQVAIELGRRAILIELNPKYAKLIRQREFQPPIL